MFVNCRFFFTYAAAMNYLLSEGFTSNESGGFERDGIRVKLSFIFKHGRGLWQLVLV